MNFSDHGLAMDIQYQGHQPQETYTKSPIYFLCRGPGILFFCYPQKTSLLPASAIDAFFEKVLHHKGKKARIAHKLFDP